MKASLLALAEARGDQSVPKTLKERAGTIQGLYLLTGGNPRLIKTFYRLLTEGLRGDIRTDLERLLDEFTPYFKAVVDALPVQQQRIFDAVALAWDPVEVSAVSRVTRLPSNQISAQLRALGKAGLITEAAGHPKRKTYLLADRFSNIHYLMRHGRAARNRFDWFVALVRLVFPDTQAETLAKLAKQTAECGPDGLRDARDLMHSALIRAESADARRQLLHAALRETWNTETLASLSNWLDLAEAKEHLPEIEIVAFFGQMPTDLRRELGYEPSDADWWCNLADVLERREAWPLAESAYRMAIGLNSHLAEAWGFLGNLLALNMSRPAEAEDLLRKAIEIDPNESFFHATLGNVLEDLGRYAEAEGAFRVALKLEPEDPYAWMWLGDLLGQHMNRAAEAERSLRRAIEIDPTKSLAYGYLAKLLARDAARMPEARSLIVKATLLDPSSRWHQILFERYCRDSSSDMEAVLPSLATRCAADSKDRMIFNFTVETFLQYARLTKPSDAMGLLESLPDPSPFETLMDTFRAHADREHLNRLAPERRALVIELLARLSPEGTPVSENEQPG
jgi:tetratricopeptide (TPR) repeat protein